MASFTRFSAAAIFASGTTTLFRSIACSCSDWSISSRVICGFSRCSVADVVGSPAESANSRVRAATSALVITVPFTTAAMLAVCARAGAPGASRPAARPIRAA